MKNSLRTKLKLFLTNPETKTLKSKFAFLLLTNRSFRFFQKLGVHVSPVHYYSPIPDLRELSKQNQLWDKPSSLAGIEMNDTLQLDFLQNIFPKYGSECDFSKRPTGDPWQYQTSNIYFGFISAAVMHCMIRHYLPKKIIEVGAGNSTYAIANACQLNARDGSPVDATAIDPYPNETLRKGFPGLTRLIAKKIQDVDLALLCDLKANDIFSIDTSHAVKTGGDVTFLFLEVLPLLAPGVVVHIHDIFLPGEYPKEWMFDQRRFWTEQYLLQAFLIYNSGYEVLCGQRYAELKFPGEYAQAFNGRTQESENHGSYSFWIRRTAAV